MSDLVWFEINPPRTLDLAAVTSIVRPLATRPVTPLLKSTPLVIFELWGQGGMGISWRIGVAPRWSSDVMALLGAHIPGIGVARLRSASRPPLKMAADVRTSGWSSLLRTEIAGAVSAGLYATMRQLKKQEVAVVQFVIGPSRQRKRRPVDVGWAQLLGVRPVVEPDATALRLWREKSSEPIFAATGRIGVRTKDIARGKAVVRRLGDALQLANSAHARVRLSTVSGGRARKVMEPSRQPRLWSAVLNTTEVASLIGWPIDTQVGDDLPVIGGHIGRAPSSLLVVADDKAKPVERVLGESLHPAQRGQLVTVPVSASLHHLHVVGPTGSGKSTLLAGLISADVASGRAALVIDPKGDLVADVLARIPEARRDDVVVIEPDDTRSVGLNVLAGDQSQAERRADQIVHLLAELHHGNLGPRSTDVALHALITVSRLPGGTFADVPILLTNPGFRRRVLAQVADPLVLTPWWAWFNGLSDAERGQVVAPLLNKLRTFLSRDALRRMVGQAEPKFDLDELFSGSAKRIVLVNLNRGSLGRKLRPYLVLSYCPRRGRRSNVARLCPPASAIQ